MPSALAAVDTSVLIAWQNPDEPGHADATTMIATWPRKVIHTLNLAEFLTGYPADDCPAMLAVLARNGFAWFDTTAEALAAARRDTGLKMPDACVLAVARAQGADAVLTLDQRLLHAAERHGFA